MKISDDGIGFTRNNESKGMGIRIMGYRSQIINASFDIQSAPGNGTTVTVSFKRDIQIR
jgi:two-component system NarL family sensor kinase